MIRRMTLLVLTASAFLTTTAWPQSAAPPAGDAPAPPATTEPTAAEPAATAAAAPDAAAPTPAAAPALAPDPTRVIALPVEFIVKQQSVGAVEAVPEWTDQAQKSLQAASESALGGTAHLTIVPLPSLTPEESATLREHLELFKVIGSQLEIVQVGGAAWKAARESADYRIGPGLRFLRERSGARYAFLLTGAQVRQSGGTVLMQLAFAGVGVGIATATGTYTYAGIVDLDTGQLTWAANSSSTQQFGIGGGDTRTPEGAGKLVEKLFTGYPRSTLASFAAAPAP